MPQPVYVIGAGRTDFKRNFRKEGKSIRDIIVEAGTGAIADSGIQPRDVQSGVVGNFASGLFTRQLHLGSFLVEIDEGLLGIPTMHVEAACASGGAAVLTAAHQIMSGAHDVVLIVGAEQQKTMSPADGSDVLGAAADYHAERSIYGDFMFPKLFARIADTYMKRYGLTERQLAQVAVKNYANAKRNPQAQTRDINLTLDQACVEIDPDALGRPEGVGDQARGVALPAPQVQASGVGDFRQSCQHFAGRRLENLRQKLLALRVALVNRVTHANPF